MSYLKDIKVFQKDYPAFKRPLNTCFSFRCNELGSTCHTCSVKSSCHSLSSLTIPLPIIEEVLKSHPELLV